MSCASEKGIVNSTRSARWPSPGYVAFAARHQCDGVVVAAVRDPLPIQPAGEIGVEVRVVVVHLRVLVLRIELDDRHPRLPPVAGRVGAVRIEVLPEDVLGGVGLPRPGPAGDEGVPERERVAVGVVVLHAVVDGGRLGRRPHLLAADGEVSEEDAVLGNLQSGLDLGVVGGLLDDCARLRHPVGHPAFHVVAGPVDDRHRLQLGHELVVALGEVVATHLPASVDLGGVVRPELLCVLQPGDPAEQPLAVRVRDQEVLSEPDRLAVPRRDERFQRRLVRVLRDPEPLRDGDDAEPDVLAGRLHVVRAANPPSVASSPSPSIEFLSAPSVARPRRRARFRRVQRSQDRRRRLPAIALVVAELGEILQRHGRPTASHPESVSPSSSSGGCVLSDF